jgi:hypothetical protein
MLDIAKAFKQVGRSSTSQKALEFAVIVRASKESQKNHRKIQEFLF